MKTNKNYPYAEIEDFVNVREEYTMLEYGTKLTGQHFIVLKGPRDVTISFILWDYDMDGYVYKCVFSELKK